MVLYLMELFKGIHLFVKLELSYSNSLHCVHICYILCLVSNTKTKLAALSSLFNIASFWCIHKLYVFSDSKLVID